MLRRLGALVGACVEGREGRLRLELARARADLADARREAARLHKLFEDAGEGQYNVLALIESYQAKWDEAERDAHHFREQAINCKEEFHRLKEVTTLKCEDAIRQAVEADRAAVAEWLRSLMFSHARDAGLALLGELQWLLPPPPPPKSSTPESEAPHA